MSSSSQQLEWSRPLLAEDTIGDIQGQSMNKDKQAEQQHAVSNASSSTQAQPSSDVVCLLSADWHTKYRFPSRPAALRQAFIFSHNSLLSNEQNFSVQLPKDRETQRVLLNDFFNWMSKQYIYRVTIVLTHCDHKAANDGATSELVDYKFTFDPTHWARRQPASESSFHEHMKSAIDGFLDSEWPVRQCSIEHGFQFDVHEFSSKMYQLCWQRGWRGDFKCYPEFFFHSQKATVHSAPSGLWNVVKWLSNGAVFQFRQELGLNIFERDFAILCANHLPERFKELPLHQWAYKPAQLNQ